MKKIFMIIIYILLGLFSSIIAFLSFSPQFGKNPSKSQQELYSTFDNYKDGAFTNIEETVMITGEMPRGEFFKEVPGRRPDKDFTPDKIDFYEFKKSNDNLIKFVWIGHSAFLFNIDGKLIMLDPMLGDYCAPVPIPSLKRYQEDIALSINDIDSINNFNDDVLKSLNENNEHYYQNLLLRKRPTLFNSYKRLYFQNPKDDIRLTIDSDLYFFSPITNLSLKEKNIIIEAKFNKDVNFLNKFKHLSLTRYSKYVKGTLQTSFFNPVY